jgi:hypothetical protein
MTPGFAKPRSELPWLPYESLDRVIINAHNFTPPTPAPTLFGGELLIWCPSLDDSGNGTTTLNDLSGNSRDGTLTNFALGASTTSNWIADTSNGGVRALIHDGTNDFTTFAASITYGTQFTVSMWYQVPSARSSGTWVRNLGHGLTIYHDSVLGLTLYVENASGWRQRGIGSSFYGTSWRHLLCEWNGNVTEIRIDGVARTLSANNGPGVTGSVASNAALTLNASAQQNTALSKYDDIRFFDRLLTADEKTALASKRGY